MRFETEPRPAEPIIEQNRTYNKAEVIDGLDHLPIQILGSAEEVLGVPPHANEANIVALKKDQEVNGSNTAEIVRLYDGTSSILGIFKPQSGEADFWYEHGVENLFMREYAMYLISEHFGLDIVPPTTVREVEGRIGSLQYLMPPKDYQTATEVMETFKLEWEEAFSTSPDFLKIGALDHIGAQIDRHRRNFLVRTDGANELEELDADFQLVAIDNGSSLVERAYHSVTRIHGPLVSLTVDPEKYETESSVKSTMAREMPDWLLEIIRDGLRRKDEFDAGLFVPAIPATDFSDMWYRTEQLVRSGCFVSRCNAEHLMEE